MKTVPLNNLKLLDLLSKSDKIADEIKQMDFEMCVANYHPTPAFEGVKPYSNEYLDLAMKLDVEEFGFPRHSRGICQQQTVNDFVDEDITKKIGAYGRRVSAAIGAHRNALFMVYPPGGYIGWHHNGNADGYNILFTYNESDQGWFKYRDSVTGEVVTMQDPIGWSCKAGYYPNYDEAGKNELFWHTAHNDSWRRTIAFVVPLKHMWLDLIDMAADGDVDLSAY